MPPPRFRSTHQKLGEQLESPDLPLKPMHFFPGINLAGQEVGVKTLKGELTASHGKRLIVVQILK